MEDQDRKRSHIYGWLNGGRRKKKFNPTATASLAPQADPAVAFQKTLFTTNVSPMFYQCFTNNVSPGCLNRERPKIWSSTSFATTPYLSKILTLQPTVTVLQCTSVWSVVPGMVDGYVYLVPYTVMSSNVAGMI